MKATISLSIGMTIPNGHNRTDMSWDFDNEEDMRAAIRQAWQTLMKARTEYRSTVELSKEFRSINDRDGDVPNPVIPNNLPPTKGE